MAPQTIDEERFASQETLDMTKPQGTAQGIPVKQILHQEYPRALYKHPVQPYREVLHRNVNHEVVHRELVATEHLVHVCHSEEEHKRKVREGWQEKPYIPQAPPDPTEDLYSQATEEITEPVGKPQTQEPAFDTLAAQKLLLSRGYPCDEPAAAVEFVEKLATKERRSFMKDLAEFIASNGGGK